MHGKLIIQLSSFILPFLISQRRSIHYTEVFTHRPTSPGTVSAVPAATSVTASDQLVPRDREVVLYSELNVGEVCATCHVKNVLDSLTPSLLFV